MRGSRAGHALRRDGRLIRSRRLPLDAAVVPGLLLLIARDLALFDPPRVLAWRLLHDSRLADTPAWIAPFLPAPSGAVDRDPVALLLAALATMLALAYAALAAHGARAAVRAALVALGAALLVVLPSVAFIGMGMATDRPYGQDGGVVQLPLALDRILAGDSPYGADYSGTILARQARVSSFWEERGGNPILRHHAYLPGTHLVMMPFHLLGRGVFGFFDPRFVTLVFYALVAVLAGRVASSDEGRLVAAAVAALNPLVYWHQIFGANDLVFVAMLLGVVLVARGGRPLLAGALLGLACATKQLAWPFAPFLLLALSGARGFRDLGAPATWRRLAGPLAVAAGVFLLVVLPVAALDFGAFWGDIVVYNVGLPGGDNYPLGGTPGFGFANFLIYFGRVTSLREHVSLSGAYALLLPLGLLLAHRQMREARPETALVTGSVALVASVYFSRVVHPNYLVPAAVLLPVGVLACRLRADLAVVPLLLLGLAVDVATGAVFRTAWEQAAAAGLPERLGGLASALAPRAGEGLTRDPFGLVFAATAAGLGVAYLVAASADVVRRARLWLVGLAAALVVAVPLLVVVAVGDRTGLLRTQDPRPVQAAADAKRLVAARSPYALPPEETPRGREAFSSSFRAEPPAEHRPDRPLVPPGLAVLAAVGRIVGARDVRLLALGALALLAGVVVRRAPREAGPSLAALALLAAPLSLGTVLGSPDALALGLLAAAWSLGAAGRARSAGLVAGVAAALDHRAALLLPLLLVPLAGSWRATVRAALVGYAALVVPVLLLDPGAALARLEPSSVGAGLGLFNLFVYAGAEASGPVRALAALAPLAGIVVVFVVLRGRALSPAAAAALAALAWLVLDPASAADAVAWPLVWLATAVAQGDREEPSRGSDRDRSPQAFPLPLRGEGIGVGGR